MYQKAAENEHAEAQYKLATSYYNGEGTEKDLKKAFHWYRKAAENGNIKAQHDLTNLCKNSEETE